MDPNANLQEQEAILNDRVARNAQGKKLSMVGRIARLRELRSALQEWIDRGGFEPTWADCPRASKYYGRG